MEAKTVEKFATSFITAEWVLSFRSTFGRSTGHNFISSIGSTNILESLIGSTNVNAEKFKKIYPKKDNMVYYSVVKGQARIRLLCTL